MLTPERRGPRGPYKKKDYIPEFWKRVKKTKSCWEWLASKNYGYGVFYDGISTKRAHRFSYELHKGSIPNTLVIDHLCRNRSCVNPDHLRAVTSRENNLFGPTLAAKNASKTHCKRGHEFTEDNILKDHRSPTYRACKKCRQQQNAEKCARYRRNKLAKSRT